MNIADGYLGRTPLREKDKEIERLKILIVEYIDHVSDLEGIDFLNTFKRENELRNIIEGKEEWEVKILEYIVQH